ncbi:PAS domain S-box protein [candidate division KSB1 bacterium]|nr:PAS domain S-box protein [candidate division KSB1 bacterium]
MKNAHKLGTLPIPEKPVVRSLLTRLWRWLTEPSDRIVEASEMRRARLLSALLISIFLPVLMLAFVVIPLQKGSAFQPLHDLIFLAVLTTIIFTAIAYWLSRTRFYYLGAKFYATVLLSLTALAFIDIRLSGIGLISPFLLLAVSLIFGSLVLSIRSTAALATICISTLLAMPLLLPKVTTLEILQPFGLTLIIAVLSLVAAKIRRRDLYELEQVALRLSESEANLTALVENTQDSIWSIDSEYRIVAVNSVFQTQFAMAFGKVLRPGKNFLEFLPEDLRAQWLRHYNRALAGEHFSIEQTFNFSKSKVDVEISFNPIISISGTVTGVSIFARNITAQKHAKQALESSEERYRKLVELSPVTIIMHQDEKVIYMNDAGVRLFGAQSQDELIGKPILEFVHPDYRELVRERIKSGYAGERANLMEEKLIRKDGHVLDVEVATAPITFQGRPAVQVLINDVSVRKAAEQALRASEEKYRTLIENMHEGVIIVDSDDTIQFVNKRLCDMFGYDSEEMLGKSSSELFTWPDGAGAQKSKLLGIGNEAMRYEIQMQKKAGEQIWVQVSAVPMGTPANRRGAFGIFSDISSTKRSMADQQKAKEAAEIANRAKSQFLANMSHEIRTPMNVIIGMTDLAMDGSLSQEQEEYLTMAKDSAYSLLGLLNDILDISKIEAGKMELEIIGFSLRDIIEQTIAPLRLRAKQKSLAFQTVIPPEVPDALFGDPWRLRQVVVNLVGNAIKFTEQGHISFKVEKSQNDDDHCVLHFVISDTGIGIPEDKQELIFDVFTQADSSTTRQYGGSGLGLAISSQLVKMMNGRIWVESESKKGSVFHFTAKFGLQSFDADYNHAEVNGNGKNLKNLHNTMAD